MPRDPARSRLTAGLAVLALVLGPAAIVGAAGPARPRPICFATDPPSFVLVLEVTGQGATVTASSAFSRTTRRRLSRCR